MRLQLPLLLLMRLLLLLRQRLLLLLPLWLPWILLQTVVVPHCAAVLIGMTQMVNVVLTAQVSRTQVGAILVFALVVKSAGRECQQISPAVPMRHLLPLPLILRHHRLEPMLLL